MRRKAHNLILSSPRKTKNLASFLAQKILRALPIDEQAKISRKNALVFALKGDLGAGKTTFVQGFIRGLGIRKKITSPTFVLVKSYKVKSYKVYHIDCYRIKKPKELLDLGLKKILNNPQNIVLIEWPEKIKKYLPKNAVWIEFKYGKKENERIISFI